MTSETTEVTVYPDIPFRGDKDKPTNFVDLPGLLDTEGRDQEILNKMVNDIKVKCPKIDMILLCFEKGKFDTGVQKMIKTYENLLDKGGDMWKNMIVVITKVSYTEDDYDDMGEWIDEMEKWKHNFRQALSQHYKNAYPTVLAISQDITKPKREENKVGTEQHNLMLAQMDIVYAKAAEKFISGTSMNLRNLKYILSEESFQKWQKEKSGLKVVFNKDLNSVLSYETIKQMFRDAIQTGHDKVVVKGGTTYYKENNYKKTMQEEAMPVVSTVLKVELKHVL